MIKFSEFLAHFEASLQKFSSDVADVLDVFGKINVEQTKSLNAKKLDGTKANKFALVNHTHSFLPKDSAANSTLRVNGLPVKDLAFRNHSHDFVRYSQLQLANEADVPMIPNFYQRYSQVLPINSNNVLTDNTNYYIVASAETKGLKFIYAQTLLQNIFIQIDLVSTKRNYNLQFLIRISGVDIPLSLEATESNCKVTIVDNVYDYSEPNSTLQVRLENVTSPKVVITLENGQKLSYNLSDAIDYVEFISIEASSSDNALIRLNSPDMYILEPDQTKITEAKYYKISSAQRLNYRSRQSFALKEHHHDGVHERNIVQEGMKRACRSANFYALESMQTVYEGDTVRQIKVSSFYHPLDLFATAKHSHFDTYARRNKRVMKAGKIYTSRGLITADELAKREHFHEYVSKQDRGIYAVKPGKVLESASKIQKLKGTLVRYIQQFKTWTKQVSFYSAKHIPKNIFGNEVFPNHLPSYDMYLTNNPGYWPAQSDGCRAGAYGPNAANIFNSTIANNYFKPETFWEGSNNPMNRLIFRFKYTNGSSISKSYTPSRFHVAYVSKQTYEYIVKRARGKLIVDSTEPTVLSTSLTFFESIPTSAERAKSSVLNVMPNVITTSDGAYWVAVLPAQIEESNDGLQKILNSAVAFVDNIIYTAYSLLLTLSGILQFAMLFIHKFVVDFIGSLAYSVAVMSDTAFCVPIPLVFTTITVTVRNDILNLANTIWNAGVDYLASTFFVPSISVKYVDGLQPIIFYRTRPSQQYSLGSSDIYDPYPLNPLYPDEFPGTVGVNQGYGTTIGRLQIPFNNRPEFVFAAPFMYSPTASPVTVVSKFANNYLKYFAILGRYQTNAVYPYSERIGSTSWAALLSIAPYSAQEVNFGVLPSRDSVTVINCGHPFNLLIFGKEE